MPNEADDEDRPDQELVSRSLQALRHRFAPVLAAPPVQDTDPEVFAELARETAGLDYYRRAVNSRCL